MIHTTIGVYASGNYKMNGVCEANLSAHIAYNKQARPGRALFVDGKCAHVGNLSEAEIKEFEAKIAQTPEKFTVTKDTAPYQ